MTPSRFIILLAVIVVVIFAVGLAVGHKTSGKNVDPEKSWVSVVGDWFESRQRIDPAKDLEPTANLREHTLVMPAASPSATLVIRPNPDRPVRKAEFKLTGGSVLSIHYQPSPEDEDAMPLDVKEFKPGESEKLVFLEHGGTVVFTRRSGLGAATIQID